MLERGQKVNLTYYYHGEGQVDDPNWIVEEYDNGLLKASKPRWKFATKKADRAEEKPESVIFNLRSIGFLKVELVE